MKKTILIMAILLMFPLAAFAQNNKEVLTLKRDLIQERVLRVQAELVILKTQYQNGQVQLQALMKELEKLNADLKFMEPEKEKKAEKKK